MYWYTWIYTKGKHACQTFLRKRPPSDPFSAVAHRSVRMVNIYEYQWICHDDRNWTIPSGVSTVAIQKHRNNMHEYLYIYYQNSGKVPANYGALTTSVSTPSSPLADGNSRKAQGAPPVPPVVVINGGCVGRSQHDSLGEKQFLGFEIFRNMTQTSSTLRHPRPWSFLPRWCGPIIRQTRSAWVLGGIFWGMT